MKILLANYRYFVSGGPERYMFNVTEALAARGHEVVPFSIRYTRNRATPYGQYFVEPLGRQDEVTFREQRLTPRTLWRTLSRLFYSRDVERAVVRMVADTQPQVAYVLCYLRKLSPSLLVGLKRAGLPIVVRLSDFAMFCPQAHCLRGDVPCELCVHGNLWPSVRFRCVQNGLAVSTFNALATYYHRLRGFFDLIDVFVTTNQFMYAKMLEAGFSEQRLRCIPTPVDAEVFSPDGKVESATPYVAYVGRLEPIKGVHVLLEAWRQFKRRRPESRFKLRIAGSGNTEYTERLGTTLSAAESPGVRFLGDLERERVAQLLAGATVSVIPSLWYENLPNALLESYACGTPVLASDLGSLSQSVIDGETGHLFRPGDSGHLAEKLMFCLEHPEHVAAMSQRARQVAEEVYSPQRHVAMLEELFSELVRGS